MLDKDRYVSFVTNDVRNNSDDERQVNLFLKCLQSRVSARHDLVFSIGDERPKRDIWSWKMMDDFVWERKEKEGPLLLLATGLAAASLLFTLEEFSCGRGSGRSYFLHHVTCDAQILTQRRRTTKKKLSASHHFSCLSHFLTLFSFLCLLLLLGRRATWVNMCLLNFLALLADNSREITLFPFLFFFPPFHFFFFFGNIYHVMAFGVSLPIAGCGRMLM